MAGKKALRAQAFIRISENEEVLWYEVTSSGEVIFYLSEDESRELKRRMMERTGREMSLYLNNHPEAAMWGKTN